MNLCPINVRVQLDVAEIGRKINITVWKESSLTNPHTNDKVKAKKRDSNKKETKHSYIKHNSLHHIMTAWRSQTYNFCLPLNYFCTG